MMKSVIMGEGTYRKENPMDDFSIIELYWKRNEDAIAETAKAHGRFCFGVSMNIVVNKADAEECVNDTYLRTWNSIPPQRPTSLRAFLGRIVRNLSIDRYRENHAACRNADLTVALDELASCLPAPDDIEGELIPLLEEFLYGEEQLDRRLFMGRYWHAYPVKELARHYGLTPNAVSLRLSRVRDRLRAYLEERGYRL
jgi:RNA polymerase sigma-70 factor (ECF subfamily)